MLRRNLGVAAGAAALTLILASCAEERSPAFAAAANREGSEDWTDRVWVEDAAGTPGAMRIFLSNGILVEGACWNPYRLSIWRREGESIVWNEDGRDISAAVSSTGADGLTLTLDSVGEARTIELAAASAPYVCPDFPR